MESNGKNFPLLFLWLKVYNFQKNVTNSNQHIKLTAKFTLQINLNNFIYKPI